MPLGCRTELSCIRPGLHSDELAVNNTSGLHPSQKLFGMILSSMETKICGYEGGPVDTRRKSVVYADSMRARKSNLGADKLTVGQQGKR